MKHTIKNRNHLKMITETFLQTQNSEGLVFIMHGLGGKRSQLQIQSWKNTLFGLGYDVVLFDTTHSFGESEGLYEDATTTQYYQDLENVIGWAKTQDFFQSPFGLIGHSMGGICSVLFAQYFPQEISFLIALSPVISGKLSIEARGEENIKNWKETGWDIRTSASNPSIVKKLKWSHMEDRLQYDTLPKAKNITCPTLLIVGEKDPITPPHHVKLLYENLVCKKDFIIIDEAEHTFTQKNHLDEIERVLREWMGKE